MKVSAKTDNSFSEKFDFQRTSYLYFIAIREHFFKLSIPGQDKQFRLKLLEYSKNNVIYL